MNHQQRSTRQRHFNSGNGSDKSVSPSSDRTVVDNNHASGYRPESSLRMAKRHLRASYQSDGQPNSASRELEGDQRHCHRSEPIARALLCRIAMSPGKENKTQIRQVDRDEDPAAILRNTA